MKIAETVGWVIGTAIGLFMALCAVAGATANLIAVAFGAGMAHVAGSILTAVGSGIVAFGKLVNMAQSGAQALGDAFIAGVNIAIDAINGLISAMNKLPIFNIASVNHVSSGGSGGVRGGGAGDGIISFGEGLKGTGALMESNASSALQGAMGKFSDSIDSFGSTVKQYQTIGKDLGSAVSSGMGDFFGGGSGSNPLKHFTSSDLGKFTLLDPYNLPFLNEDGDGGGVPGGDGGGGGGGSGGSGGKPNIGTVDKVNEVDLSDGTMKLLKNMYERDLFQRFINIDSSMQFSFVGTANSDESAEDIATSVDEIVTERLANLLIV